MQSISEIKEYLDQQTLEELPQALLTLELDARKGVQKLILASRKRIDQAEKEAERLEGLLKYERRCYRQGYQLVAGIDEVGRGPLAGPVVTAAVILPKDCKIDGVDDSKKLSAKKREQLYDVILEQAIACGIGVVPNERIDEINILQATYEAMRQSLDRLKVTPDFILADAVTIPLVDIPQKGIVKGDSKSISIGAASIVAKVYRDRMMEEYDKIYPGYDFASNKGYGSASHIAGIQALGLTPIHRRSFVKNIMSQGDTKEKGIGGEEVAVKQMKKNGYEILERNFWGTDGEIDIIAKKESYTVFVEVKYRTSREKGMPGEAVDKRKQRKIINAAKEYIAKYEADGDFRFDVAEVLEEDGQLFFRYIENAFWEE